MALSILQIAKNAADELAINRPTTLIGASEGDDTPAKLYRQLVKTVKHLHATYDWQVLYREKTFTTIAAAAQTGAIPTDFLRFVPETLYNRTRRYKLQGPLTADEWQAHQALLSTQVYMAYRIRGNSFLLVPTPPAGETIAYEYITNTIGTSSDGSTERTDFADDADVTYFDGELVTLGTVWRYRQAEGNDYAEPFRDYQLMLADRIKMDGGRRRLDMSTGSVDRVPVPPRAPDTLVFN